MVNYNNIKPLIAIVGRPNVGKSTLFNEILGENSAIIDDMPGVTRDLHYEDINYFGKPFTLIDTGGFHIDEDTDVISKGIREQIEAVLSNVDGVIFLANAETGIHTSDKEIFALLRQHSIRTWVAVSHIDSARKEIFASEFYELGVDEIFPVSGKTGFGTYDLLDEVTKDFWTEKDIAEKLPKEEEEIKIAVVGRPNVGKSTLVNAIIGEDKMLVSPIAGTTMDPIDSLFRYNEHKMRIIDTAGIRRKKKVNDLMEKAAILRAFRSIDRADIVVFLMDSNEIATEQDLRLLGMAHAKNKGIILVLNKWDLIEKETGTYENFVKDLRYRVKFAPYAPIISISGLKKLRVNKLLDKIIEIFQNYKRAIPDEELTEWLESAVRRTPPPLTKKHKPLFFSSAKMLETKPPTIKINVNKPNSLHFSYHRYLLNRFYATFNYEGVAVKFVYKKKSR